MSAVAINAGPAARTVVRHTSLGSVRSLFISLNSDVVAASAWVRECSGATTFGCYDVWVLRVHCLLNSSDSSAARPPVVGQGRLHFPHEGGRHPPIAGWNQAVEASDECRR